MTASAEGVLPSDMKSIVCNGIKSDAPTYSFNARTFLCFVINQVRTSFILGNDQLAGVRFNSNEQVLLRIRSHATEARAMVEPLSWAHAALEDCASADAFYAEKHHVHEYDEPKEVVMTDERWI